MRLAIGATRARLIQQMLVESALIALAGGLLGTAIAVASFQGLVTAILSSLPSQLPSIRLDASPDWTVVGFAFALTMATSLLFGVAPAWQASKINLASGMKLDGAGSGRRTHGMLRGTLVGVQVAVSMLLLITATLLGRGLYSAQTVDPGFQFRRVAQVSYDLRGANLTPERARAFTRDLMLRLRAIPGIESVAQSETSPLSLEGRQGVFSAPGGPPQVVRMNTASPGYFDLIGTPIILGSDFTGDETSPTDHLIVTESTARLFWPGQEPIGQTLEFAIGPRAAQRVQMHVIGVVRDAQLTQVGNSVEPFLYFPAGAGDPLRASLVVRSGMNWIGIAAAIRHRAQELDRAMVVNVIPLEENLGVWLMIARLVAGLSGSLSALGLILASIGVYGVVSYAISRRLREVGIRMALGASAAEVRRMILKQAMRPVLIGAAIGLAMAAALARLLESVLFGVSAHDPLAFITAPCFLIAVAVVAILLPARRAMNVDPMTTLRYE